jgi:predicted phage tail component-like protein
MYNFIDTTEVLTGKKLPAEAMKINGNYIENIIPGYRTLSVSGRESLSAELNTYETGVRAGSSVKSRRYPAREIIVKYQLVAKTANEFRVAFNMLGGILNVEDAELIFDDEPDKFFIGTPTEMGEVEPGSNSVVGEFTIFCADPFKYSVEEYEVDAQEHTWMDSDGMMRTGRAFFVDYNGTYKSYPTMLTSFYAENEAEGELQGEGDCGYVAFFNENEKILQFGDPDEIDGVPAEKSQRLTHWYFDNPYSWVDSLPNWVMNSCADLIYDSVTGGTMKMGTDADGKYYLTPAEYTTGEERFGVSITRILPADSAGALGASDYLFEFDLLFAPSQGSAGLNQAGVFYAIVEDGDGKIVTGLRVAKHAPGLPNGKIEFIVNGKAEAKQSFDMTYDNEYFGVKPSARRVWICKQGKEVVFNICGDRTTFICNDEGFDTKKAMKISFAFFAYKDASPLLYNGIYYTKLTKHNCSSFIDIPNKMSSGDVLKANCRNMEVTLNGLPSPELGAIGNDWEGFYLKPGTNMISIGHSDWFDERTAPEFKIRYREVFL